MNPLKRDIIDNQKYTMAEILNYQIPKTEKIDISTGYFNVGGYAAVRKSLEPISNNENFQLRLLLGKDAIEPEKKSFEAYAKEHELSQEEMSVKTGLYNTELTSESLSDVASLITLLKKDSVQVRLGRSRFNHSKCYIMDDAVFIGSSNFTEGGLKGNYELNAGLYQSAAWHDTKKWFNHMWEKSKDEKSKDEKQSLIDVLEQSKFGAPVEPFHVYIKMLFERYRPHLERMDKSQKNTKLTQFQNDAVQAALHITDELGGAIIADATGLGKTNIGIDIIRQKVLLEGRHILLIAPSQVLKSMWDEKLKEVDVKVRETLGMERLSRIETKEELKPYEDIDFILIDESQNLRSKNAKRRENLMKILYTGKKKQVVLLTATPINNSIMDLYYQLSIITKNDESHFRRAAGIYNLYQHMREAAKEGRLSGGIEKIQQLLDAVMVRRTRAYIKDVYPDDKISGRPVKFPEHQYDSIRYSMTELFGNVFEQIVNDFEMLKMTPYSLENYNRNLDEAEKKKYRTAAHLQVILLLKRFESSIRAVTVSLENKVKLYRYIKNSLDNNEKLIPRDLASVIRKHSVMEPGEDNDYEERILDEIKQIGSGRIGEEYDIEQMKQDMDADMEILLRLQGEIKKITIDTKLNSTIKTIMREKILEKEGKKVLIFSEYSVTAKYIKEELQRIFPNNRVECITGDTKDKTRKNMIQQFAPKANPPGQSPEIDILVSTEVLAEGQNLQDCNYVINYDLPWNPMRIVQRTGRIDRLTSEHDIIHTRACYPDKELDVILELMGKLIKKIDVANEVVGTDSEILGEEPTPKQYNGTISTRLKKLATKDGAQDVIKSLELESDMMPEISPINELFKFVKERGMESMDKFQMGCRAGKRGKQEIILAYTGSDRRVYFVTYDMNKKKATVPEDDSELVRRLRCTTNTKSYLPEDGPEHRESFMTLLEADKAAREEITRHNEWGVKKTRELKTKPRNNTYDIESEIVKAVQSGKISRDAGKQVVNIINADGIIAWQGDVKRVWAKYGEDKDVIKMVTKLMALDGLFSTKKPKVVNHTKIGELKLIGAMFISDGMDIRSQLV